MVRSKQSSTFVYGLRDKPQKINPLKYFNMTNTNMNTLTLLGTELLATRNKDISLTIKNHTSEWVQTKANARAWFFQNRANANL